MVVSLTLLVCCKFGGYEVSIQNTETNLHDFGIIGCLSLSNTQIYRNCVTEIPNIHNLGPNSMKA